MHRLSPSPLHRDGLGDLQPRAGVPLSAVALLRGDVAGRASTSSEVSVAYPLAKHIPESTYKRRWRGNLSDEARTSFGEHIT